MEEGEQSEKSQYRGVNPTTTSSSHHEGNNINNISTAGESSSSSSLPEAAGFQISDQRSCFSSGTYIVQVPRDQVYRIPPRENATLLENYRRGGERAKSSSSSSSILLLIVIIVLFIGAVLGSLLVIFLIYNNPSFSIEHFLVKQRKTNYKQNNYIEYDIRMKIRNPNKHVFISYQSNSNVILSFSSSKKKIELGSGKFPKLRQGSKDSAIVNITVHGSRSQLPKEIEARMRMHSKTKISLFLSMNVPVKFKVGIVNVKSKMIHVSCSFFVDRFNYKGARVLTQECTTRD